MRFFLYLQNLNLNFVKCLLYHKYNNHKTELLECVGLANIIEEGNANTIKDYLEKNLEKYRGKIDNVVLGCTHYPLVQKEIGQALGNNIKFFNGANRLAIHLKNVLEKQDLIYKGKVKGKIIFIDSSRKKEKEDTEYARGRPAAHSGAQTPGKSPPEKAKSHDDAGCRSRRPGVDSDSGDHGGGAGSAKRETG